jgi:hypothetical protein
LSKTVADAIIDLRGCKEDEKQEILNQFRMDLKNRLNDEKLRYYQTLLKKIQISIPPDIEDKIRKSIEFSKEIKKKCNIQSGGST